MAKYRLAHSETTLLCIRILYVLDIKGKKNQNFFIDIIYL